MKTVQLPSAAQFATDLICLKRASALDKIANTIEKPKGAVPDFGLPKWKVMPLESKIPLVPGPEAAYNFTRQKIGKGLWISTRDAAFNLSDPYCHEMKFDYDPLHDKHLLSFFSKPQTIQHLIKIGQITRGLDAKCSLRDYNMYRKYLRRLHCDGIKKEIHKIWQLNAERRAIDFAENQAKKEYDKLRKRERLTQARRGIIEKQKEAEKLKIAQQKEKQVKLHQRLILLAQLKREEQQKRKAKGRARAQAISEKKIAAAEINRRKVIRTLLEWRRKEQIRTKALELRLALEREQKRRNIEKKWKMRQVFQEKEIEKERLLLELINQRRQDFLKGYNDMLQNEERKMQKLLQNVKMYLRCYKARRAIGKDIVCCETAEMAAAEMEKLRDPMCKPQSYPPVKRDQAPKQVTGKAKGTQFKKPRDYAKEGRRKNKKAKGKKESVQLLAEVKKSQSVIIEDAESKTSGSSAGRLAAADKCRCERIKLNKVQAQVTV